MTAKKTKKTTNTKKTTTRPAAKTVTRAPAKGTASGVFTAEEREAMRERARETKAAARRGPTASEEGDVLARIAAMSAPDRAMGEKVHAIIKAHAPGLTPRLWYGMPAYARDGKVVCFFQASQKFKTRYCTLGFSDKARLDDGHMWSTGFALTGLTAAEAARIATLVQRAVRGA